VRGCIYATSSVAGENSRFHHIAVCLLATVG
jgi:hypothetical protein